MRTSAILVVGLPISRFPDRTPLFFCQVAAHVDVSGKVGWKSFNSEGRQAGPYSYLSPGLITSNLCQPELGGKSGMLHHVLVAILPSQRMWTDLGSMRKLTQSCWCYDVSNSREATLWRLVPCHVLKLPCTLRSLCRIRRTKTAVGLSTEL
jgi:hypothetical protein